MLKGHMCPNPVIAYVVNSSSEGFTCSNDLHSTCTSCVQQELPRLFGVAYIYASSPSLILDFRFWICKYLQ